jgi:hypothetical protein
MSNFITVGRRLIPSEHIVFVEPFDVNANPKFQTTRDFKGRVVLVNRDSVLIEETPKAFADANGLRMLADDGVATNPAIRFRVETFVPAEGFVPSKAYATRLLWRDLDSNDQSKLLLSLPETVLAVAVRGETDAEADAKPGPARRRGQAPAKIAATP